MITASSTFAEIRLAVQREQLRGNDARWEASADEIRQLPLCDKPCESCPFVQDSVDPVIMAEVRARVAAGQEWVCHKTAGIQGELLPDSQRCRGAKQSV